MSQTLLIRLECGEDTCDGCSELLEFEPAAETHKGPFCDLFMWKPYYAIELQMNADGTTRRPHCCKVASDLAPLGRMGRGLLVEGDPYDG